MTQQNQDFELWQGNDKTLTITVYDDTGAIKNISATPITIDWVLQTSATDSTGAISKGGPLTAGASADGRINLVGSGSTGQFTIRIAKADTASKTPGTYYHEARIIISSLDETLLTGKVVLHAAALTS